MSKFSVHRITTDPERYKWAVANRENGSEYLVTLGIAQPPQYTSVHNIKQNKVLRNGGKVWREVVDAVQKQGY